MDLARSLFKLGYELSPIILTGGIAENIPGKMLPIIAITEGIGLAGGLLRGQLDTNSDNYFAHFKPVPGGMLVNNQIAEYPFANLTVAANASIMQPLPIALEMISPANTPGGYVTKLLTMTTLKQSLDAHVTQGGAFTVATPSFIYTNCLLQRIRDMGSGDSKQTQVRWIWEFTQPLITEAQAGIVYNALMDRIGGGLPQTSNPTWSSLATSVGSKVSNAAASVVAGAKNLFGVNAQ